MIFLKTMLMIPLSLYIHFPWCVKKCPYCDFNSHTLTAQIPEKDFINALIQDLEHDLPLIWGRKIQTIFLGGGTPSLFSSQALADLLNQLHARLAYSPDSEITLEANPGTFEYTKFKEYREAGINRLSIGIQSFQDDKLQTLGRIHSGADAKSAVIAAKEAGFDNFNLDLMFGLPSQTLPDALYDLETAILLQPTHLSWYQLTLEPNTRFHQFPPDLPDDEHIWDVQTAGQVLLAKHGYKQYEVSAYSQPNFQCQHNRNYWQFGDYLGIGPGAHSKITDPVTGNIQRLWKIKHPKQYLGANQYVGGTRQVPVSELALEFMMNALRLNEVIPVALFQERTTLPLGAIIEQLEEAKGKGLLTWDRNAIQTTEMGRQYLNNLLACFM